MAAGDFIEVFVSCPVPVCEERDPKGLYKKARAGQIPEFTGISAPYEEPNNAELTVHTDKESEAESLGIILNYLEERGYVGKS